MLVPMMCLRSCPLFVVFWAESETSIPLAFQALPSAAYRSIMAAILIDECLSASVLNSGSPYCEQIVIDATFAPECFLCHVLGALSHKYRNH